MQNSFTFEEHLNYLAIDILETLDIYPNKANIKQVENIIASYIDAQQEDYFTIFKLSPLYI